MRLNEIAQIKTGLVLTRKKAEISYEIQASYRILTLKNIDVDGFFNDEPFETFYSNDQLDPQYFTQPGDVLIRLNHPHTAVFIGEEYAGLLVPSYFAIIKIVRKGFLPEFVAWYLNTEEVKKQLLRFHSGSMIPSTNKRVLGQIDIPELPEENQEAVIILARLFHKEKRLYQRLIREKEQLFKAVTRQVMRDTRGRKQR